ncbi:UvrB/UvrC motif-containing protein [Devosia sp.]|uniref:UvrB/UvrC motif-containing protein n=1 Tax=Devosia sp. TaxID=1871048 RepID=UPI0032637F41
MSTRSIHAKIVALEGEMAKAAEAMDFEAAARLRNEIAHLRGERPELATDDGDALTTTVSQPPPGAMGLGTNVPVRQPPKGWVKPKKPDLMTKNVKPGGR